MLHVYLSFGSNLLREWFRTKIHWYCTCLHLNNPWIWRFFFEFENQSKSKQTKNIFSSQNSSEQNQSKVSIQPLSSCFFFSSPVPLLPVTSWFQLCLPIIELIIRLEHYLQQIFNSIAHCILL